MACVARAFASDRRGWVTRGRRWWEGEGIRGDLPKHGRMLPIVLHAADGRGGSRRSLGYRHVDISSLQAIPQLHLLAGAGWRDPLLLIVVFLRIQSTVEEDDAINLGKSRPIQLIVRVRMERFSSCDGGIYFNLSSALLIISPSSSPSITKSCLESTEDLGQARGCWRGRREISRGVTAGPVAGVFFYPLSHSISLISHILREIHGEIRVF